MHRRNAEPGFDAIDDRTAAPPRGVRELAVESVAIAPNLVKLLARLSMDPRVPIRRRALVVAALAYVISPVDLIPDFVPGLGRLDDVVLVAVAIDRMLSGADAAIVAEHWDGSEDALDLVRSAFAWGAEIVPSVLAKFLPR
ncbi:MAG TPA: YkvA family protein [Acidimicrobiia bacterium]|nr:YkvA family protein [Acidimicrobiia bacterium]